jgi:hypothetical protein
MWVEAALLREDLDNVDAQLTPIAIAIGASQRASLGAGGVHPSPNVGLRIECNAKLAWARERVRCCATPSTGCGLRDP